MTDTPPITKVTEAGLGVVLSGQGGWSVRAGQGRERGCEERKGAGESCARAREGAGQERAPVASCSSSRLREQEDEVDPRVRDGGAGPHPAGRLEPAVGGRAVPITVISGLRP